MARRGLISKLLAVALLAAPAAAGCGSDEGSGESYAEIVSGLKRAALAGRGFDAMERAEGLEPVPRAALEAFCETNREMLLNSEAGKVGQTGYYVSRLKVRAERELPFVSTRPVAAAVGRYTRVFDVASFDPAAVRRYARACYR